MLKAFTWSRRGRKKNSRFSIKTDNWGWAGAWGLISTLFNGSRHSKWLAPNCSPKRGLPLQRISYKRNRNKGTKKEKGKKKKKKEERKTTCIRLSAAYSFFFFFK